MISPSLCASIYFSCMNLPFGNADQLSVNKQRLSLNRYPSDRAVERRQPNKRWNQISASLICQGSAVMWTHTLLFFIPVYATEERLFECHRQMLSYVTVFVQMWYLFREQRLLAFLPLSCFNGTIWAAWQRKQTARYRNVVAEQNLNIAA